MRRYTMCATQAANAFFRRVWSVAAIDTAVVAKPVYSSRRGLTFSRPFVSFRARFSSATGGVSDERPQEVYVREDLPPGPSVLKRIVSEFGSSGSKFILPTADHDAMQQLSQTLSALLKIGVKSEFLIDACVKNSDLFRNITTRGEESWQIVNVLVESCGMTYENAMRIFASYGDDLLNCSPEGVQSRVDVLVSCGISAGKGCGRVVSRCPAVLFARDPKEMSGVSEALCGFFSRKEVTAIVQITPEVLLKNIEDLEEKYEYIFFQMCIEGEEFKECAKWAVMSLDEIMIRHEFLLKTGRYTTPDPKHPQKKMENPRLHLILDSTDDNFAIQVAGVSREEWTVYRAFSERLSGRSGDEDRPYERVKPSKRKAFERRRKEGQVVANHVFDVAALQSN